MSDLARWRRIYVRLWSHAGFLALSEGEKLLVLYLLTGPLSNRIGLFKVSFAAIAEDLGTSPDTVRKRFATCSANLGWPFDADARVLYIPSWWRWNPPSNENQMKGSLKDLNEIPSCGLVDAFANNLETLPVTLHQTFIDGFRKYTPKGSRRVCQPQEQKQEQDQKQEQNTRGAARRARATTTKNGSEEKGQDEHGADDERLRQVATQVLDTYGNLTLDAAAEEVLRTVNDRKFIKADAIRVVHQLQTERHPS